MGCFYPGEKGGYTVLGVGNPKGRLGNIRED